MNGYPPHKLPYKKSSVIYFVGSKIPGLSYLVAQFILLFIYIYQLIGNRIFRERDEKFGAYILPPVFI